uniref:Uncharacterized protein n=1 Tax=Anguilla anguilla TaxID=7936 RepID=A0A0E9V8K8_ANGAN
MKHHREHFVELIGAQYSFKPAAPNQHS